MNTTNNALKAVATGQQAPQDARDPYTIFKNQLEKVKGELLPLMGNSRQNVDAFVRVVLNAVNQNPDLLSADRRSLLTSCTRAAQDGLVPDGREAVLNVRNTKVKRGGRDEWVNLVVYEPMVAGYIKNLYEHPDVALVDAAAVFANDRFKFVRGDQPRLEHEPNLNDDPGDLVAAYLVVHLRNGQIKREVMPKRDIDKARAQSKSNTEGPNSPWTKWPDQMAIKSVIKRGSKQLPKSNKFDQMDQHDNEAMGFAAAPGAMGEIMPRGQGAEDPAGAPALTHNPSETFEFQLQPAADVVPVTGAAQAPQAQATRGAQGDTAPDPLAEWKDRINAATDRAAVMVVMGDATSLPQEQYAELEALANTRFPA